MFCREGGECQICASWADANRRAALCQPLPTIEANAAQRKRMLAFWEHVLEHAPTEHSVLINMDAVQRAAGEKRTIHCLPEILRELEAKGSISRKSVVLHPPTLFERVISGLLALAITPSEEKEYVSMAAVEAMIPQILRVVLARVPPVWADSILHNELAAQLRLNKENVDVILAILRSRQQCVTITPTPSSLLQEPIHRFATKDVGVAQLGDEAIALTDAALLRVQKAIFDVEERMERIRDSVKRLPPSVTKSDTAARTAAARMLTAKKKLAQLHANLRSLENLHDAQSESELNKHMIAAMKSGTQTLHANKVTVTEVEEMVDALHDATESVDEVSAILANAVPDATFDEDELIAELDALVHASEVPHPSPPVSSTTILPAKPLAGAAASKRVPVRVSAPLS